MVVGQVFDFELNDSSLLGMFNKINSFTDVGQGGILGIFILLVTASTLFLMMKTYGVEKSLSVTMIISFFIGLFLKILGLIHDFVFYICIILLIVGVVLLFMDSERYE